MNESKLTFIAESASNGERLKHYLRDKAKLSSRLMRGAAMDQRISVNDKVENLKYVLKEGDVITVHIGKEESQNIEPENIPVNVVYEDSDVLVANKEPGMVVHPTKSHQSGTLANGLIHYFREKGENCIVRLVSRLDMDTSGLIMVAKNQFAHMALARDMKEESFEKSYLAVIHGHMPENEGTIDLPIFRPTMETIKRAVDERGQNSVTHYEAVESYKNGQLVKLTLETGRTHQIRVHLTHLGHPLYGDSLYCEHEDSEYIGRQALHAYKLAFPHPRTGEVVSLETELPEDMKKLIEKLKAEN